MSTQAIYKKFDLGDGREISIETGRLAKQANGAVVVKIDDTMLMATVVANKEPKENADFLPLTVEYKEKYAATGKFPGGFFKREARPSEYEILISRLVDRALRPLFPDNYYHDTQVQIMLISGDKKNAPDALAALAASAALTVSDIPFQGPISEVRVAKLDGKFVINPEIAEFENAELDLMVAATMDNIMMVEGEMKEVSEADMLEAIKFAHEAIKLQCQAQLDLAAEIKPVKWEIAQPEGDEKIESDLRTFAYDRLYNLAGEGLADKHLRKEKSQAIRDEFMEKFSEEELEEKEKMIKTYFHDLEKDAIRNYVLDERKRIDGRQLDEIRPIWSEIDYLPAAHGSAIFTRGETQAL